MTEQALKRVVLELELLVNQQLFDQGVLPEAVYQKAKSLLLGQAL